MKTKEWVIAASSQKIRATEGQCQQDEFGASRLAGSDQCHRDFLHPGREF